MGVVAGTHEWAGLDVAESHVEGFGFELGEFAGRVEPGHGQVIARGAQVLADSEDVAADSGEVAKDVEQFVGLFAEADHHAGLGNADRVELLCIAQQLERALIARAGAYDAIEPRDGFGVVVENFRLGVDDDPDRLRDCPESRGSVPRRGSLGPDGEFRR